MNIIIFRHASTNWIVAAFYSLDSLGNAVTVFFSSGAFERGDDFGVADARIVRDKNDKAVRLVVNPATIKTGRDAYEMHEEEHREARESMSVYRLVPQPDVEIVFDGI